MHRPGMSILFGCACTDWEDAVIRDNPTGWLMIQAGFAFLRPGVSDRCYRSMADSG